MKSLFILINKLDDHSVMGSIWENMFTGEKYKVTQVKDKVVFLSQMESDDIPIVHFGPIEWIQKYFKLVSRK